jgi:hypothetical protein
MVRSDCAIVAIATIRSRARVFSMSEFTLRDRSATITTIAQCERDSYDRGPDP